VEGQCTDILQEDGIQPRYKQSFVVGGQKTDIEPLTGNRNPILNRSIIPYPNQTAWWDSPEEMAGSYKGASSASGYATTYDRVRVMSALTVMSMPLYNYNPGSGENVNLGLFVGLQADGMVRLFDFFCFKCYCCVLSPSSQLSPLCSCWDTQDATPPTRTTLSFYQARITWPLKSRQVSVPRVRMATIAGECTRPSLYSPREGVFTILSHYCILDVGTGM
jgi:hypothetical protein